MNPDPTLTAIGAPLFDAKATFDTGVERLQNAVSQFDAPTLDKVMNEEYRQAGCISWSATEYFASETGKANAGVGLHELAEEAGSSAQHPPSWWPENTGKPSSAQRPLAGLKVVDLTRVIAGPTAVRGLAEMGASVMRVTSPHIADIGTLHID